MTFSATYSPEDNKLRLSASERLSPELYARVKDAGFIWAPHQKIFVAPRWTPAREDLLLELAGEIGDEDTSLVDRAEERAERFTDYRDSRAEDAEQARAHVEKIAGGIPLGQPILIGHHSQRRAEKDAEKIKSGMQRAVKLWETSQYWQSRAAGAIGHAKYKELPAVRARRIKTLEAEVRQLIADYTPHENQPPTMQTDWNWRPSSDDLTVEQIIAERKAAEVPHVLVGPKGRGCRWIPQAALERIKAAHQRSIRHLENRLTYERAMLAESGGLTAEKFDIQIGGRVSNGGDWYTVTKLNKKDGALFSVSVVGRWSATLPVEDIRDYRPPEEGAAEKVKAATKQAPLCNFRSEGCLETTTAQWKLATRASASYYVYTYCATGTSGAYRHRTAPIKGQWTGRRPVFLTDAKELKPPAPTSTPAPELPRPVEDVRERPVYRAPEPTPFDAIRESLRAGVQAVSAPQLFPTPPELAARMVEEAAIPEGARILEPSAGTGNILRAIIEATPSEDDMDRVIVAVELSLSLADRLRAGFNKDSIAVQCCDFLSCNGNIGTFDRILMNPPFADGQDIKHIEHAATLLKPGGRLVAICANGPRQNDRLKPWAEGAGGTYEPLPADTFKDSGTGVNTAIIVYDAPEEGRLF